MLGTPYQKEIINKLNTISKVYIVGGAVRDQQIGLTSHDIDAVAMLSPEVIEENLRAWGYVPHVLGTKKQTVTIFKDNKRLDIAELTGDIREDALRRDFTMNAVYLDTATEEIVDPLDGLIDLKNKSLKACGKPLERFQDDSLRILRMVRFAVAYDMDIEKETWDAAIEALPLLSGEAPERITEELSKILVLDDVEKAVRMLDEAGYFKAYIPELARLKGLVQNKYHSKDAWEHTLHVLRNTDANLLLRLAALFHDTGKWETASRECFAWGKLEQSQGKWQLGEFRIMGRGLERWKNKSVEIRGARLDNYPDTIQVKQIRPAVPNRKGFEWVVDGKRHFLGHEKESAVLVKKILPRFRWEMFLNVPERKGESELLYLIENHMIGTLTFMNELREGHVGRFINDKVKKFAWDNGWNGRNYYPDRLENLLNLWRADFFGGKQRVEGDVERFESIQRQIREASLNLLQRMQELDWGILKSFAEEQGISGELYGRFKETVRNKVMLNDGLDLSDRYFLEKELTHLNKVKRTPSYKKQ